MTFEAIISNIYWIALGYGAVLLLNLSYRHLETTRPGAKRIGGTALMIVFLAGFFAMMFFLIEKIIWVLIGFSLAGNSVTIAGWWKEFQRRS
jgi:hypothetical protein